MANKFPLILNTSANQIQEIASGDNLDLTGCGINNAGVITATSFTGAVTGNADTATLATNVTVTANNSTNETVYPLFVDDATGTQGAESDIGFTYNPSSGNLTSTQFTGTLQTAAQTNITSVGTLSSLNVSGNVSIGGTLTYEDVTNIDSVGIVTAREGVFIPDTKELKLGNTAASPDLKLYSTGTNGWVFTPQSGADLYMGTNAGEVYIQTGSGGNDTAIKVNSGGSVDLYHNNQPKVVTTSYGIRLVDNYVEAVQSSTSTPVLRLGDTGVANYDFTFPDNATIKLSTNTASTKQFELRNAGSGNFDLLIADNGKIKVGDSDDLSIYHLTADNDGYIKYQNENGHLKIGSGVGGNGGIQLWDRTFAKEYLTCDSDGAVKIFFNDSQKFQTTNTGAQFTGTDFGFNTTPGGTPASKAVFLAIGDSDTGIVQDGDGQLELWANATEVANINAIDGYTSVKPITTTGNVSVGDFTAKSALFTDNGTASPIVDVRSDDGAPWHLQIANDGYNTGAYGLNLHLDNSGIGYIRNIGSGSYNDLKIGVNNGTTTSDTLTIDETGVVVLGTSGVTAGRLTLNDNGSASPLLRIKTDDGSPYAMIVGNDTYNTGNYGLHQYQENGGNYFIRLVNNAEYKNLYIQTSNNSTHSTGIYIDNNRSVGLNYEGGTRFWTRSNGATVQGNASAVSLDFNSNSSYRGSFYADNNNNIGILDNTGNWVFLTNRGAANSVLYDSHFRSDTNGSYDLGTSSYRWRNIYTSDLDLSNESRKDEGGNEVDGTWGAYTIQEGEDDLFLINRRSGKKYKFNLTEVS